MKKEYIVYGRYGELPWDSSYFGSQEEGARFCGETEEEVIAQVKEFLVSMDPYDDCPQEEGEFTFKLEKVDE